MNTYEVTLAATAIDKPDYELTERIEAKHAIAAIDSAAATSDVWTDIDYEDITSINISVVRIAS